MRSRIKYLREFGVSLSARLNYCDNSGYIYYKIFSITNVVDYISDRVEFRKCLTRRDFESFL